MDMDELRQAIDNFSFDRCKGGNKGFNRILIQLFGLMGHGRSTFINTCIYVWQDGEYQSWAEANAGESAVTWKRLPYKLTNNITLVDNRGLHSYTIGDIYAQLGNLLPLGQAVQGTRGFELLDRIFKSEKLVKYSDFIVPVYVHSVGHPIFPDEMNELKNIFQAAGRLTGIYPIVVLTHKNSGFLTTVESSFRDMGVEKIFALENYTPEDHLKTRGRHEEVMKFLYEVIKNAKFRVEHETCDPVKHMHENTQFVMNYVHEREKKMEQENLEKRKAFERTWREKEVKRQEEALERERQRGREAEEDLRKKIEDLERQRSADQARHEEELKNAKKKKKNFRKKK
ncbi:uncharacterized protein [Aquarana catesbeiana]|uniref:uncharacterized protein isoform X2 n=1 Tax=Aquarana catesbeiana TaxID=8400 RepID=UPI003CC9DD7B